MCGLSSTHLASGFCPTSITQNANGVGNANLTKNRKSNFQVSNKSNSNQFSKYKKLQMSSIDRDPDENKGINKIQSWVESKLPAPPEDQLTMGGDIGSIFFYTFLDHTINGMYDDWLNSPEVIVSHSASAAIESSFAASSEIMNSFSGNSLPVWFDTMSSAPFGNIPLTSTLPISHHINYAPAVDTIGMASVLLASTWMLCGYFTGAFRFKNTLECSTSRAILVTTKTWVFTTILMLLIAYASDFFVGSMDCLHKSVGLTTADYDYIVDSLSVLLMWRFTLGTVLGSGEDSD
jgi:hypothetical protein